MNFNNNIDNKYSILTTFSYLVLTTISLLTTTYESRILIEIIRVVAMAGILMGVFTPILVNPLKYFKKNGVNKNLAIGVILYVFFTLLGIISSSVTNSFWIVSDKILLDTLIILIGIIIFSINNIFLFNKFILDLFIYYILIGLIFTIILGGLDLKFPPHFVFTYFEASYSQGISQFFGLGAIAAVFQLLSIGFQRSGLVKFLLPTLTFIYLLLSLLGGARGDAIFATIVILLYWLIRNSKKNILLIILILGLILSTISDWSFLENFILFQRLVSPSSDLGHRDVLINKSIDLLIENPFCLIAGCGFGYFQKFYGYEVGLYPHNILIEYIITFGIPLTFFLVTFVIIGVRRYLRDQELPKAFLLIYLYLLLLGLKSGSALSSWMFMSATFYLASIGVILISPKKNGENN